VKNTIQRQSVKYWIKVFKSCGFVPYKNLKRFPDGKWVRKNNLYIGYKPEALEPLAFTFLYNEEEALVAVDPPGWLITLISVSIIKCFSVKASEFLQEVKYLADPEKLPLLIGVPWVKGIVVEMLKEEV